MSFFNKVKKTLNKGSIQNKVMYCAHCGSDNVECSSHGVMCKNCNLGDDRVEIIENCSICGTEIRLNTKYYKVDNSRNICCRDCSDSLNEIKKIEEDELFDLYKNCKVCGKQYKVNNKCNDGVCYSCQLENIKNETRDCENIFKKEIKYCKNCGTEFYVKNSEEICDICKRF